MISIFLFSALPANSMDRKTATAEMWVAIKKNDIVGVRLALKNGADVNGKDEPEMNGYMEGEPTPVHFSVMLDQPGIAWLLLESGGDPNSHLKKDPLGDQGTLMSDVIRQGYFKMYTELIKRGVSNKIELTMPAYGGQPEETTCESLFLAAAGGNIDIFKNLQTSGISLPTNLKEQGDLLRASVNRSKGSFVLFQYLRENKVGGNELDELLIHELILIGIREKSISLVEYLLKNKKYTADAELKKYISTALDNRLFSTLELLLSTVEKEKQISLLSAALIQQQKFIHLEKDFQWYINHGYHAVIKNRIGSLIKNHVKKGQFDKIKEMTKILFSENTPNPDYLGDILHSAFHADKKEIFNWVLSFKNINADMYTYNQEPVLWKSLENRNYSLFEKMLKRGAKADFIKTRSYNERIGILDLLCELGISDYVTELVKAGAKLVDESQIHKDDYNPPIVCAVQANNVKSVKAFLDNDANPEQIIRYKKDEYGNQTLTNLLLYAVENKYNEIVKTLLIHGAEIVTVPDIKVESAMDLALINNNDIALDYILNTYPKINLEDKFNDGIKLVTPMEYAFSADNKKLMGVLIKHGAKKVVTLPK